VSDLIVALVYIVPFLLLLVMGYGIGRMNETSHLRRLQHDEQELRYITVTAMRRLPSNWHVAEATLVSGTVVIATDYFKTFSAGLRNLFGGEVRGYVTLVDRARREASVRMLREAQAAGANAVWNVRFQTSTIGGRRANGVEIIVYGTAMHVR